MNPLACTPCTWYLVPMDTQATTGATTMTRTYYLRQGRDRIRIEATSFLQALAIAYELTGKDRWTHDSEATR